MSWWRVVTGDARAKLDELEPEFARTCVTSPPYWRLRDYGHTSQLGMEATPAEYVANLVEVLDGVRRALRPDGTLWLNLGDSYAGQAGGADGHHAGLSRWRGSGRTQSKGTAALKRKDLVGIPWAVAFALRDAGWWLRSDIVWAKPRPMPESVRDRPTRAHEYVFLLSKSSEYFYDADAIAEPCVSQRSSNNFVRPERINWGDKGSDKPYEARETRNRRDVWSITTMPFADAHFAVMPTELATLCVLAGSAEGDVVLDPFAGAGTTGIAALRHERSFVGIELTAVYADMARERLRQDAPLFNAGAERP